MQCIQIWKTLKRAKNDGKKEKREERLRESYSFHKEPIGYISFPKIITFLGSRRIVYYIDVHQSVLLGEGQGRQLHPSAV